MGLYYGSNVVFEGEDYHAITIKLEGKGKQQEK